MPPENNSDIQKSPFDLQPLVEFTRNVNSSFDLEFILNNVLFTLMGKLLFTKGIVLLNEHGSVFRIAKIKGATRLQPDECLTINPIPNEWFSVNNLDESHYPWVKQFKESGFVYILDLTVRNQLVGILALGNRMGDGEFDEREEVFLRSLVNISATAIEKARILLELKEANRKLGSKVQELNTLFEMSKEFSSIFQKDKLIKILVFSLLGHLGMNRYLIAIKSGEKIDIISSRLPTSEVEPDILKDLLKISGPVLVSNDNGKFPSHSQDFLVANKIAVVVPMTLKGETQGIILLGHRMAAVKYTQEDLEFLSSLGNLAMISIENTRLFEETLEKQKMEEELKLARSIQIGLLPKVIPQIPGYNIAARSITSKEVGGDYFDIVQLDDHRYLFVIADVAGKGTPAALLMSNLQAIIRAIAPLDITIEDASARVNDLIFDNTSPELFITFFWAILNIKDHIFKYVNAGHNLPILVRSDRSVELLEKGGMVLGVMRSFPKYEHEIKAIKSGDTFLLFTDGISEAMNREDEQFGEERIRDLLLEYHNLPARELLEKLITSVSEFTGDANQADDITAVVLKRA